MDRKQAPAAVAASGAGAGPARGRRLRQLRWLKLGLPFFVLVLGGSFGLREFTTIRYDFSQVKSISNEAAAKMGLKKSREATLETAYDEIQDLDLDNWENKRGPRPWEDNVEST